MQPILAAVDGEITRLQTESIGIRGVAITIRDSEGWRYNYFHDNNDTPGTDDGQAAEAFRLAPGLVVGSQVVAGQIIGYMGDSGNAEDSVTPPPFRVPRPRRLRQPLVLVAESGRGTPGVHDRHRPLVDARVGR